MTRQMRRQAERAEAKAIRHQEAAEHIKQMRRALLARQKRREDAGFYEGKRSTASCVAASRSRINTRLVQKGKPRGRILREVTKDGKERHYHATKGWREYRA